MRFEEAWDLTRHIEGVILAVGGIDTGKTTWIKKALEIHPSAPLALISADLGQGILGPPTMLGGHRYEKNAEVNENIHPEKLIFIGQTTPAGKYVETLIGIHRLICTYRENCPVVFVDTDGLVHGTAGRSYKSALIELARPCSVFLFGDEGELSVFQELWSKWSDVVVYHVEPDDRVRKRSGSERYVNRQKRYETWFRDSIVLELPLFNLPILSGKTGLGKALSEKELTLIQKELSVPVYRMEVAERGVYCIIEGDAEVGLIHTLKKRFPDVHIHLESIYHWRNRLIGGVNHEGWAVAMGRVRGWSYGNRNIEIELRGEPVEVSYWVLGEGRYPETLFSTGRE